MPWILLLLTFLAAPASAAAPSCPPYSTAIAVDFQTLRPAVQTNNTLNITGIRNLIRDEDHKTIDAHTDALGVTVTTPAFALDGQTRVETTNAGSCVYLESVKAEFGFRNINVYVASEYQPGTCEYGAILDHENQHVAIGQTALQNHAGRMRLELERLLGEEKPVFTRSGQRATNEILDQLSKRMNAELTAFYDEMDARNSAIDSQHNYNAIAANCKDWSRRNVWPQTR